MDSIASSEMDDQGLSSDNVLSVTSVFGLGTM
jgi:hypothetical protein